jgi:hypothetical protein
LNRDQFKKAKKVIFKAETSLSLACTNTAICLHNRFMLTNNYKDSNFTILIASLDDRDKLWQDALFVHKMPWVQLSSLKGWNDQPEVYHELMDIPNSFLLDPEKKYCQESD